MGALLLSARMGRNMTRCPREAGQIALDCVSRPALDVPRTTSLFERPLQSAISSGA